MKSVKIFFSVLFTLCCMLTNAQTTYKGVTIDRDKKDNTCVVVTNANNYPVKIKFEYKIGSRDTEWVPFRYGDLIEIPANEERKYWAPSKIYGLNLSYVDIIHNIGQQILEAGAAFFSGVEEGKKQNANGQQ